MQTPLIPHHEPLNTCIHCSLKFRYQNGLSPSPDYCCLGCKTVYELLMASGLKKFYDIKAAGVCFSPPLPALSGQGHFEEWDSKEREIQLFVGGVHCAACLWLLEQIPKALPNNVCTARLDVGRSLLHVELTSSGKVSEVAKLIRAWGYRPHLLNKHKELKELQKKENHTQIF